MAERTGGPPTPDDTSSGSAPGTEGSPAPSTGEKGGDLGRVATDARAVELERLKLEGELRLREPEHDYRDKEAQRDHILQMAYRQSSDKKRDAIVAMISLGMFFLFVGILVYALRDKTDILFPVVASVVGVVGAVLGQRTAGIRTAEHRGRPPVPPE